MAGLEAVHSIGDAHSRKPRCTLVTRHIDISTGGMGEKTPINEYQKQYKEQQFKYIKQRAAKLGYQYRLLLSEKGYHQRKGVLLEKTPCWRLIFGYFW